MMTYRILIAATVILLFGVTIAVGSAKKTSQSTAKSERARTSVKPKSAQPLTETAKSSPSSQTSATATKNTQHREGLLGTQPTPASDLPADQPIQQPVNTPAAAYEIQWESINLSGENSATTVYEVSSSIGGSPVGALTTSTYDVGAGYQYGAFSGSGSGCDCPSQCDYDDDGFLTSVDLGQLVDVLFFGGTEIHDPSCPTSRGDFDNDNFPTSVDLGGLVDHLFFGGDPPVDPCGL